MNTSETITVNLNNEDREIFMSFGLLNELSTIVRDPGVLPSISLDPELREKILNSVIAKRKPSGKIEEPGDIDDTVISVEDSEKLLDWASEHLLGFFIRAVKRSLKISQSHEDQAKALESSLGGSKPSTSKKA